MGCHRTRTGAPRRRALVAVLAAGVLIGAFAGATLLVGASPDAASGPAPTVLHAAPALVDADRGVDLALATVCLDPENDSCVVDRASLFVRPGNTSSWTEVVGRVAQGAYRFQVAPQLVPADGFSYWFRLQTRSGDQVDYPPGGQTSAIRVLTTAALPAHPLGAFDWDVRQAADQTVLSAGYGDGADQVGRRPGRLDEPPVGPSSFDVGPDGSVYVVDWINRRIQVFAPNGHPRRSLPLPERRPMDLAVGTDGQLALATFGTDATAFELDPAGRVLGRYPVGYGVVSRVASTSTGPRVMTGPSQWSAVRAEVGQPLSADAQAQTQVAAVPPSDGQLAVSQELPGGRVAFVWCRPDGSRAGAIVTLPAGVAAGSDFFVRPTPDGGAIAARGLWDRTHNGVGIFRFDAVGRITSFRLLPEPSVEQDARFSTVRFLPPHGVLVVLGDARGLRIDRFEVNR